MYEPSEESMMSPCVEKSPREKLNEYLSSRDISPIRNTLSTSWEMASDRTKRLHLRKAQQVVHICREEIAPGESAELFRYLHERFETGSNVDGSLMEALLECYNNAGHWSSRRQILSIMADKVNFKDLRRWIRSLTKYRYMTLPDIIPCYMGKRGVKEEKLDHFLSFITSTHIIQDLPFGENTLRLSSREE